VAAQGQKRGPDTPSNPRRLTTDPCNKVTAAAALAAQFQCAVIIIHHCGTNENRPRGHTSLTGAVETQIGVKRDAAGRIVASVEYMKDGPEEGLIVSKLEVVDVGVDEDGEPITSCVIAEADGEGSGLPEKPTALAPAAKIALTQLINAVAIAGEIPPASNHIPPHIRAVPYDLWRRHCYAGQIAPAETDAAREKAFQRSAKSLIATGRAAKWGNWVWPAWKPLFSADPEADTDSGQAYRTSDIL
jgi:hypothetical protein